LFSKIFVLGRQLSLEALTGLVAALLLLTVGSLLGDRMRHCGAALLLLAGFVIYELESRGEGTVVGVFNLMPLQGQLANEWGGVGSVLEGVWPFAGLSVLVGLRTVPCARMASRGSFFLAAFVLFPESLQLRYQDVAPTSRSPSWPSSVGSRVFFTFIILEEKKLSAPDAAPAPQFAVQKGSGFSTGRRPVLGE